MEKAFAGMASGEGDSGTGRRMFGYFLNWMNEHTTPVFVVATANSVKGLPPELLRKGRFDECFYVGLPNAKDRASILTTHLHKFKVNIGESIKTQEIERIAKACSKYSAAELAAAVKEAAALAFYENRPGWITSNDLSSQIESSKPLAVRESASFSDLLEWAKSARWAAESEEDEGKTESSGIFL